MKSNAVALVQALRRAASRMETERYEWGHMGRCNCGYLAQELAGLTDREIHRVAMQGSGDWSEQLNDYCPTSGLPMDELISALLEAGLQREDLIHLERLSKQEVLACLPPNRRNLRHNIRQDAILYIRTWADLIEYDQSGGLEQLLQFPSEEKAEAQVE